MYSLRSHHVAANLAEENLPGVAAANRKSLIIADKRNLVVDLLRTNHADKEKRKTVKIGRN